MQFLWSNAPGNCPPLCQNNYLSRSPRGQQWNVVNFCKVRYNRAIEDLKNSTCRQKKVFNQGICNLYVDPASSAYRILRYCLVSRQPPVAQSKVARQHCWQEVPKYPHFGCFWPLLPTRLNFFGSKWLEKVSPI